MTLLGNHGNVHILIRQEKIMFEDVGSGSVECLSFISNVKLTCMFSFVLFHYWEKHFINKW